MFALDLGEGAELRPLEPWQAEEYLAHMDRARDYVEPWIPWTSYSPDLDGARATLQRWADLKAEDKARLFGIWLDGTLVGGVMLLGFNVPKGMCEVGCWLEPAGAGRGLVTRAAGHLLDYAFLERDLHRAVWKCRPDNTASSAVAKRLGMRLEGTHRGEFLHHGTFHDTELWAILASEWRDRTH